MTLRCILVVGDESQISSNKVGSGCVVPIIQRSFTFRVLPLTLTALREALQEHDLRLQLMPFVINASMEKSKEGKKTQLDSDSSVKSFFIRVKLQNIEEVRIEATITAANEQANNATLTNEVNEPADETEKRKYQPVHSTRSRHSSTSNAHDKAISNMPGNISANNKVHDNRNAQRENAMLHKLLGSTFADDELVKLIVYAPKQCYECKEAQDVINRINNNSSENNANTDEGASSVSPHSNAVPRCAEESSVTEKMFVIPCAGVTEALYRAVGDTIPQTILKSHITYTDVIAIYTINKQNEKSKLELRAQNTNDHELRAKLLESARSHCPFRVTYEIKCTKPDNLHLPATVNTNIANEVEEANESNVLLNVKVESKPKSNKPKLPNETCKLASAPQETSQVKTSAATLEDAGAVHSQEARITLGKSESLLSQQEQKSAAKKVSKPTENIPLREVAESISNDTSHVDSKCTEHVLTSQELLRSSSVQIILQVVPITPTNTTKEIYENVSSSVDKQEKNNVEVNMANEQKRKDKQSEEEAAHVMTFSYNKHEVALLPRLHAKCKELCQQYNMLENAKVNNNRSNYTLDKLTLLVIAGGEEHDLYKESDLREWLALAHEAQRPLRLKAECNYIDVKGKTEDKHIKNVKDGKNSNSIGINDMSMNTTHSKELGHRLYESSMRNTVASERTVPFSVAVSVATKQQTSHRSFNDSVDDKSSSSYSKAQSTSQVHTNETEKMKSYVEDLRENEPSNFDANGKACLFKNTMHMNDVHETNEHSTQALKAVEKEEKMPQKIDERSTPQEQEQQYNEDNKEKQEDNNSSNNNNNNNIVNSSDNKVISKNKEVEQKGHQACESADIATGTEQQQHDVPAHHVKKSKKIQYKYTYLCHELRSPPLHAEYAQPKKK